MFKRLVSCSVCIILLLLVCVGCDKNTNTQYTAESVQDLLNQYFNQDYDSCADSYLQASYNNMSEEGQQEMLALMQNIRIEDVVATGDTSFKITMEIPSAEGMLTDALGDSGFIHDFENADLSTDENAHSVVVEKYLTSLLQQGAIKTEEKEINISVTTEEGKLETDVDIVKALENFIKFDGVNFVQSRLSDTGSTESQEATQVEFTTVDSDKVFMFQQNGARFLVHDIRVAQGSNAIKLVQGLSTANVNISTNDNAYFIQYKVKNLSNVDVQVSDCFKLIDASNMLLENSGAYVAGLMQVGSMHAGEEIEFSTFLVGPSDAKIIWYSAEDTLGCYVLNIVQ